MSALRWIRRRARWGIVVAMAALVVGAVVAYGDNLQPDLNTTTGGLQKTVDLGTLPANTAQSQDVFLFAEDTGNGGLQPTYPFNVSGATDTSSSTFTGIAPFDGITISGPDQANGRTGHVTWTTPAAQATAQDYTIVEKFSANTSINTSPATVTIEFSVAAAGPPPPSDTTAPSISYVLAPPTPDGTNDWYKSNVSLTWTVTENESPSSLVKTGCVDQNITADQAAVTYSCSATSDGGSAGPVNVSLKRDGTAPAVSVVSIKDASDTTYTPGTWTNQSVTVDFGCTDGTSGVASLTPDPVTKSASGADQSASTTCTDDAGNSANGNVTNIDIDKDPPLLNISGAADGTASSACSALPSRPTFAPSDALSGLDSQGDSWTTPSTASGVGTYTYSAHAADNAGNSASETRSYTVTYGSAFGGYLQPINSDGSSRFKLGSTIPVKFQLLCNGTPITNAVAKMYVKKADSQADPGVDEAISTAASTTGNLFRYDATAQQYIFNLSTKLGYTNPDGSNVSFSSGTWLLKIQLDDLSWRSINVQLPK